MRSLLTWWRCFFDRLRSSSVNSLLVIVRCSVALSSMPCSSVIVGVSLHWSCACSLLAFRICCCRMVVLPLWFFYSYVVRSRQNRNMCFGCRRCTRGRSLILVSVVCAVACVAVSVDVAVIVVCLLSRLHCFPCDVVVA